METGLLLVEEGEEEGVSIGREKRGKAREKRKSREGRWIVCVFREPSGKGAKLKA